MSKGKLVKRINNLTVKKQYGDDDLYEVLAPGGRFVKGSLTLDSAIKFCEKNTEYTAKYKRDYAKGDK